LELLQVAWKKVSSKCYQRGAAGGVEKAQSAMWGKDGLLLV
jgi:acetyl-CoA acetyltransferase